ncbi:conserved hypothetical protein [Leishmania braziliensis MHOM/BR/75/M2904]|uniref:C3H1-type domain-containing protein n=2 Tax=Leishmania braziliensis TaxID=5660 RepID=A4HFD3_LEIBR|nr:conserved hypothetical protein [Leishmania braziliensis MHOM/BR/75/M2904]KAI5684577.1 hypothetical protein MNV84_04870 [Leishmania braziliensis]CAJ2475038.1 unnamed protein product [Leishmania braziliensis]CAJ2475542.1 unnamed protein product [Leishmania braziliensis]CAM45293.1 conserved hypothetical protein [Leishmania braziliensis MHOM/BR/75/M2904]
MWNMSSSTVPSVNGSRPPAGVAGGYVFIPSGTKQSMPLHASGVVNGVIPGVVPPHDRTQEVCKYFVNGGCLRGANCPYLHELPDERHLDVNGLGFILNPNVHNAQKTVASPQTPVTAITPSQPLKGTGSPLTMMLSSQNATQSRVFGPTKVAKNQPPSMSGSSSASPQAVPMGKLPAPPKYNPPEPYLELNLPPALAFPLKVPTKDTTATLAHLMLQN